MISLNLNFSSVAPRALGISTVEYLLIGPPNRHQVIDQYPRDSPVLAPILH
jgi:hypothetical protein